MLSLNAYTAPNLDPLAAGFGADLGDQRGEQIWPGRGRLPDGGVASDAPQHDVGATADQERQVLALNRQRVEDAVGKTIEAACKRLAAA